MSASPAGHTASTKLAPVGSGEKAQPSSATRGGGQHSQPSSSSSGDAKPIQGMLCCAREGWAGTGGVQGGLSPPRQIQSGIGRLILREEMKARSNSYADPWTPPRSSASSREALHTLGYEGSLNGCKAVPAVPLSHPSPSGHLQGGEGNMG